MLTCCVRVYGVVFVCVCVGVVFDAIIGVVVSACKKPGRHEEVDVRHQPPRETHLPERTRSARRLHGAGVSDTVQERPETCATVDRHHRNQQASEAALTAS